MFIDTSAPLSPLDGLGGWNPLKSFRPGNIAKAIRHIDPIGSRLIRQISRDPVTRTINRATVQSLKTIQRTDTAIKKGVATSKIAQGALYAAGAVFAPFTGGASLALAAAAIQSSKASAKGRSFGAQFVQGIGAGAIGYVAGVGLVYGAGAAGIGPAAQAGESASFLTPFGTAGNAITAGSGFAPTAGITGGAGVSSGSALSTGVATSGTAVASAAGSSFMGTYGQTALIGLALARAVSGGNKAGAADILASSAGLDPNAIALMNSALPSGWSSGAAQPGGSDAGGGGGSGGASPAPDAAAQTTSFDFTPYLPWIAAGLGGVLLFSIVSRQPRAKKSFKRRALF